MEEIWKDISGYEGYYQVSNQGRVKSVYRVVEYSDGRKYNYKERILKPITNIWGYPSVGLSKEGKAKTAKVHRLVAIAFIPNPENKPEVNHDNGVKDHNHKDNLYWATSKENIDHAVETGLRNTKGENNNTTKLKETEVVKIINTIKTTTQSYASIGRDYGVDSGTISHINKGNNWSWLLPEIQRPIRAVDSRFSNKKK